MIIGFTGTRRGMTAMQQACVQGWLERPGIGRAVHGGCHGADFEFDAIAHSLGIPRSVWPGPDSEHWLPGAVVMERMPYLKRNERIVRACDELVACPGGPEQQRGSGTWHTIRHARRVKHPHIVIFWPDGEMT